MIAKSTVILLFGSVLLSCSPDPKPVSFKNKYARILEEFEIHPPRLDYGYPLWYHSDSVQPSAVIFLKEDVGELYKADDYTYVAEPTNENGQIVFHFSGPVPDCIDLDATVVPKYYIIADSTIRWTAFVDFIEGLFCENFRANLLFCGSSGLYCPVRYAENSFTNRLMRYQTCWPNLNETTIMINCNSEILYESFFVQPDTLPDLIFRTYTDGFDFYSVRGIRRLLLDRENVLDQISYLEQQIEKVDTFWNIVLQKKKENYERLIGLFDVFDELCPPATGAEINVRMQLCDLPIGDYYKILSQINKGLLLARDWRSLQLTGSHYTDLFLRKQDPELEFVREEFPDLITRQFCLGSDLEGNCKPEPLMPVLDY